MFYYIAYKGKGVELIKSSIQEIISDFLPRVPTPKGISQQYYYNHEDKLIYIYLSGVATPTSQAEYTQEEADNVLLKLALENAQKEVGNSIMFAPNDPKSLIEDIQSYFELETIEEPFVSILNELNNVL